MAVGTSHAPVDLAGKVFQRWPRLDREEVHLWRAPVDVGWPCLARLREMLPAGERALALTLRFQWERDRFVATRGWLRLLLGSYLGAPPGELRFVIQANGKPAVAGATTDVRFNVALAGPLALVAVSEGREVGVGVEPLPARGSGSLLTPGPLTDTAPEEQARRGAYRRARGQPPSVERQVPQGGEEGEPAGWSFHPVDAGPGYAGALALEGVVQRVRYLDCDPRWLDGHPQD